MKPKHFLSLLDMTTAQLKKLLLNAIDIKENKNCTDSLKNKTLAMIFEKSSTRTRVSFETAMVRLGGHAIFLNRQDTQIGRGEPIEDSTRAISRMVDGIMIRTFEHKNAEILATYSEVPVINGLTDLFHPCQLLADMMTYFEVRGDIEGCTVTWIGDGNNMCNSYINAARQFNFSLNIACPAGYEPNNEILTAAKDTTNIQILRDPLEAAKESNLIVTDVWASMGDENEEQTRRKIFANYTVDKKVMDCAHKEALFMHCLPAHRGEEVSAEVIDGPRSIVWQEAENRLYAQQALLSHLLG